MSRNKFKERCWLLTVLPTYENGILATYLVPIHDLNKQQRTLLLKKDITWKEIIESSLFEVKEVSETIRLIFWKYEIEGGEEDNIYKGKNIRHILKKNSVVNMFTYYTYDPEK